MSEKGEAAEKPNQAISSRDYRKILQDFDAAVCEAIAVSQETGRRLEAPAIGYATHVFVRICAHAQALVCAAPESRWVKRDFEIWDVSAVAPHARSILEGYLLFRYLADAPDDLDTQQTYVQVMHLYDCMKRIKILPNLLSEATIEEFKVKSKEIQSCLESKNHFKSLDQKLKKELLSGKRMMITSQSELLERIDFNKADFDFYWNYLSQYTHVLSFTFYGLEENGRGTGLENSFDRSALGMILELCTGLMVAAVDRLVVIFPDAGGVRQGLNSKFVPGPAKNLPKHFKRTMRRRRR